MNARSLKQLADVLLGFLFVAGALVEAVAVYLTRFSAWEPYLGLVFFAAMAALCFGDFFRRRRTIADDRGFPVVQRR